MFFVCPTCGYSYVKELSVQYIKNICKNINADAKDYVENYEQTQAQHHMKYCHMIMMLPSIVKIVKG